MISVPRKNEVSTAVSIEHLMLQTAQSRYQQRPCTAHSRQALGGQASESAWAGCRSRLWFKHSVKTGTFNPQKPVAQVQL